MSTTPPIHAKATAQQPPPPLHAPHLSLRTRLVIAIVRRICDLAEWLDTRRRKPSNAGD
jgi:hypothetical protein